MKHIDGLLPALPKIHQLGRSSPRRIQWYKNSSNKTQHGPPPLSNISLQTRKCKGSVFETAFQGIFCWRLQSDMWLAILVALRCFSLAVSPSLRMIVSEGFWNREKWKRFVPAAIMLKALSTKFSILMHLLEKKMFLISKHTVEYVLQSRVCCLIIR